MQWSEAAGSVTRCNCWQALQSSSCCSTEDQGHGGSFAFYSRVWEALHGTAHAASHGVVVLHEVLLQFRQDVLA